MAEEQLYSKPASLEEWRKELYMKLDDGIRTVYTLTNIRTDGDMPRMRLTRKSVHYFKERTVGYNRFYAARRTGRTIDMLIRIWQDRTVRPGMVCTVSGEQTPDGQLVQFRIAACQQTEDENYLRVTDLTLERMETLYEYSE